MHRALPWGNPVNTQRRMSAKQSARAYVHSLIRLQQRLGPDAPGVMGPFRVSETVYQQMIGVPPWFYLPVEKNVPKRWYKFKLVTLLGAGVYRVRMEEVEEPADCGEVS